MQLLFHVRTTASQTRPLISAKLWPRAVREGYNRTVRWNGRLLSITCSSQIHSSSFPQQYGDGVQAVSDAFESAAKARWAADAAYIKELPPQGDFASIGLGGHSPSGLLQGMLEWVHVHTGLPWWASIAVSTIFLRSMLFPLVVHLQKNAIKMNNNLPEIEKIQERIRVYRETGESVLLTTETTKLLRLYQEKGCSPLKMGIGPLVQVPLFVSFFIAIRGMAYTPVESMKSGGMLWFTDLTIPDPFFILPIVNSLLFVTSLELGGDVGVTNPQMEKMKVVFRILALLIIPLTGSFPSGLFMYWTTTSMFSLGQVVVLKIPYIRKKLNMPTFIKHPPSSTKSTSGFVSQLKKNYGTSMAVSEMKQRRKAAEKRRQKLLNDRSIKLYDKPPHKR